MTYETKKNLMDAAGIKFIDLCGYDRDAADMIIEFYGDEYEKAPETVQDRGPFDFFAPASRGQIIEEFVDAVTDKLKWFWCRSLTDDQAKVLIEVMEMNNHKMIVHDCVEIMAHDIKKYRNAN